MRSRFSHSFLKHQPVPHKEVPQVKSKLLPLLTLATLTSFGLASRLEASSVTVNTTEDVISQEVCSLRAAIKTVNKGLQIGGCVPSDTSPPDTVNLPSNVQPYVLTIEGSNENGCDDGDLDVLENLTLNGGGSGSTVISASGLQDAKTPERVFDINPFSDNAITVTLNGVTIRDGEDSVGGGIRIFGDENNNLLVLDLGKAGAAGSPTSAVLNDVIVTKNNARYEGGGIFDSRADLTLNNSQVIENEVELFTGGGITMRGDFSASIPTPQGLLTIQNTTISGNTVLGNGGGIFNDSELAMDSSTVSGNTAGQDGGGIYDQFGALALITNSTISGNQALGQEIEKIQFPDVELLSIGGNGAGGGIYQGALGELVLVNSTVSRNTAALNGGGIYVLGVPVLPPPPPPPPPPTLKFGAQTTTDLGLFNVTIAENIAETGLGGGVYLNQPEFQDLTSAVVSIQTMVANTLIAGNSADGVVDDCLGSFTSLGYNLIGLMKAECSGFSATGDQTGTVEEPLDPLLGPLQNNGGPTETHALLENSPAIDKANPEGCLDEDSLPLNRDQRNFFRPVNATGLATAICDIGAYEVGGAVLRVLKTDSTNGKAVLIGGDFTYTITVTNEGPNLASNAQLNDPLPSQVDFVGPITTSQGSCSNSGDTISCELGDIPVGETVTVSFAVEAVSPSNTVVNTVTVTTSTKEFENTGTFTSTVTTIIAGPNLLEGAGCSLFAASSAAGSLTNLLPLAFALLLGGLGRLAVRK